ncbi:hypothetical protein EMWEY_00048900 [Eimeria maxima]|uniref:Uncharacterized protein n=1 Tax=Eimeria maxima TaxID=5804 RepID=U6M2J3_EIMMA|nr:hypothetical protein EMWEY_00048900 [Eimeria maxima]CDJ58231.1 hypothetical protein EMWEY_00048900 [Eimeria maxima]
MLSNGFRGQTVGLLRRQLALSPGDGGDACTPPRAPQQSKRESKSKRPWWQLLKPSNSSSRMTETLEGPSAGEGVAWSGQHKPSSVRRPGERVEHTTNVPIGNEQSVHYQAMDTYYPFPLLGGVEAPENQSLRELLREIQDIATYLCSFHTSMFSSNAILTQAIDYVATSRLVVRPIDTNSGSTHIVAALALHTTYTCAPAVMCLHFCERLAEGLEAKYALNNGNSSYLNEPGPPDSRFKALYPSRRGWEPSHFRRDFACVAEEMLTNVLAEAEDGSGLSTQNVEQMFQLCGRLSRISYGWHNRLLDGPSHVLFMRLKS